LESEDLNSPRSSGNFKRLITSSKAIFLSRLLFWRWF